MKKKVKAGGETFEAVGILTLEAKDAVLHAEGPGSARAAYLPFDDENLELILKANANNEVLGFVQPDGNVKYAVPDPSCMARAEEIGQQLDRQALLGRKVQQVRFSTGGGKSNKNKNVN